MRNELQFPAMWAIPPGRTISDLMKIKGLTPQSLAHSIGMSTGETEALLSGKCHLSAQIAEGLETTLGAPFGFWMRREQEYRKTLGEMANGVDPDKEEYKSWLKSLPLKEMQNLGWITPTRDKWEKLHSCLRFFDVPNLDVWYRTYVDMKGATAFRTTDAYLENAPSTSAWLRQGELEAADMECSKWNPEEFESKLAHIRELTKLSSPSEFLPKLKLLCAEAGVAVVIVKAPKGCRASGATFFANPNKAVLQLSFRYLSDDQFWFSFFHEAAHLILHWDPDLLILETTDSPKSPQEQEANKFASDMLIPHELQHRMPDAAKSLRGIMKLGRDAGISYGIVVGQMQFLGLLKPDRFNRLKNRYKWEQLSSEC